MANRKVRLKAVLGMVSLAGTVGLGVLGAASCSSGDTGAMMQVNGGAGAPGASGGTSGGAGPGSGGNAVMSGGGAGAPGASGASAGQGGAPGGGAGGAPGGAGMPGTGGMDSGQAGMGQAGDTGQAGSMGQAGAGGETPEGIPAGYTLQLDEPFATMAALDAVTAGNPTAWTYQAADGGALEWAGTGYTPPVAVGESLSSFALVSDLKFGSFVLEVELLQLNPDTAQPHRDLAIVFNAQSESQYYWAHIAQTHDNRSHNIHLVNDGPRTPVTATDNGGIMWGTEEWHTVRLVRDATSGTVAVYWDGDLTTPILTATDTTLTDGYIGFGTFQDSGRARNLKIWAPSSTAEAPTAFFE